MKISSLSKREFDVIVVGAGVLGTFHAYFAALAGMRVLLMERDDWPRGASVRNFGWCIPSAMPSGEWRRRGIEGLRIYREMAERVGVRLSERGTQYLASTELEEQVLREFAAGDHDASLTCELLEAEPSCVLNPRIHPEYVRASLFFPEELRLEPTTLFPQLIDWMERELGVVYLPRTVANGVECRSERCLVTTASGEHFEAADVFICSGAETRLLFPEIWAAAGIEYCKLQMLRTVPQTAGEMPTNLASGLSIRRYPSFSDCPSWPKLSSQPVEAGYDERGIHLLIVEDFEGRLVVGDSHQYGTEDFDFRLEAETEALILRYAKRMVAGVNWTVERRWHGIYTQTMQGEIFQRTIEGCIHLISGIGGKGMTTAPALARENIMKLQANSQNS